MAYIEISGPHFSLFARWCERQVGRAGASVLAIGFVIAWLAAGPTFGWSNTWQLIVNTASSALTLVMVFVIQHRQRRDTQAINLKLDELILVNRDARNELISLEAKPEIAVEEIRSALAEVKNRVEKASHEHEGVTGASTGCGSRICADR